MSPRSLSVLPTVMVATLLTLSACTQGTDPSRAGSATPTGSTPSAECAVGSVSLSPLRVTTVVTQVSDVTTIDDPHGGSFTAKMRPVRTVTPSVVVEGTVDPATVFAAFVEKAGEDVAPLGHVPERDGMSGLVTIAGPGAIVVYESVRVIEASFTYRCGKQATSGVVNSWRREATGLVQCDLKKQKTVDVVVETVALACSATGG